jgi:hypothetical protein
MLMMMNRNPMGMMGMMRGGGMMPMMGMPYGGMMSTFGGGAAPGASGASGAQVQSMGYGFWGDRYYNKITKQFTAGAAQMKDSLIKTSHSLNTWDKGVNLSYKQQIAASTEYNRLVQQEAYQSRKLMQYNNKELQDRYTRMKMTKFNKGMAIAGNVATGVVGGAMAGFGQWGQYQADGTAIMDRGKALGGSIGAGVGGAVATGLLSAIPMVGPILGPTLGPMLGGAIGKGIGEWIGTDSQEAKDEERARITKSLASTNETGKKLFGVLEGDYSVSELKDIEKALNDGVFKNSDVSPELLEKMQANGNELFFSDKVSRKSKTKIVEHNNGGWTAVPTDGKEYVTNSLQGGEYVVKKEYAEKSPGILGQINSGEVNDSNISSLLPLGPVVKVLESAVETIKQIPQNIKMEPLNINISGTIQLDCGQGNTMDIGKELMQNPTFVNKLADLITRQINITDNAGSFDKQNFVQRYLGV